MSCKTCHHVRSRDLDDEGNPKRLYECHYYTPEIGAVRPDGTNGYWPIVSLLDGCGQWLHRLQPTDPLPAREPDLQRQ